MCNPESCISKGCPTAILNSEQRQEAELSYARIAESAFDSSIDDVIPPSIFELVPECMEAINIDGQMFDIKSPEDIAINQRREMGGVLELLGQQIDFYDKDVQNLTKDCTGPLTISASRDDQEIEVVVCMSPLASEGKQTEEVTVHRNIIQTTAAQQLEL